MTFCEISKNTFLKEHLQVTASESVRGTEKIILFTIGLLLFIRIIYATLYILQTQII